MNRRDIARSLPLACLCVALASTGASPAGGQTLAVGLDADLAQHDLFDPESLHDLELSIQSQNWETELQQLPADGYLHADLTVEGTAYPDVGLRLKGNSSQRIAGRKKPFNLTMDAFVARQNLMGYDTVNLNNGFADPTFVREILTYDLLRPFLPTPKAAYARVTVNGAYFGLYLLSQQIEGTYLREWFGHKDGLLFKGDPPAGFGGPRPQPPQATENGAAPSRPDDLVRPQSSVASAQPGRGVTAQPDLTWKGEDLAIYKQAYELKTDTTTTAENDAAFAELRELSRTLDATTAAGGPGDAAFAGAIAAVMDVDAAMWYVAAHNLFDNFDSYSSGHNYFLFRSMADRRFHILSWDMNESFGVFSVPGLDAANALTMPQVDPFFQQQEATRPLIRRLLAVPRFRADYLAHYRTLRDQVWQPDRIEARAKAFQALAKPALEADPNRLYDLADFERGLSENLKLGIGGPGQGGGGGRPVPGLVKLVRDRLAWLGTLPALKSPDVVLQGREQSPLQPAPGDAVRVSIQLAGGDLPTSAELVASVDGGPVMSLAMSQSSTDGSSWSSELPAQAAGRTVRYAVRLGLADGRAVFFPEANWTQPWSYVVSVPPLPTLPASDLVINELLAENVSGLADAAGEHADWLELYNRGDKAVDLDGYFLGLQEDPWQYALAAQQLQPGGHVLVWCDDDPEEGADHAPFKLKKAGAVVQLANRSGIADRVDFGPQSADKSYGRLTDGVATWGVCDHPSPRMPNVCGGDGAGGEGSRVRIWLPIASNRAE